MLNFFKRFKKARVHLCPEVRGVLMQGGQPLAGIKIVRSLDYDGEIVDFAITQDDGRFHFEEKNIFSRKPNNPWALNHAVAQSIWTEVTGKKINLWFTTSPGIKEHPILTEKLLSLNCDVEKEEFVFKYPTSSKFEFYTIWSISELSGYIEKYKDE